MTQRRTGKIQRRKPSRDPKVRFTLFCEGKNTEPKYFSAIQKVFTDTLISIESHPGAGVPITIAQKALKFAESKGLIKSNRRPRNSFEKQDEVWAVFDRDEHEKYEEAVRLCENNGIGVARSNPCFEVWLILHEEDYDRPDDRHQVQETLQQLRPEYNKTGAKIPNYAEMVCRVHDAEKRAQDQLRRREQEWQPHGRPSTTVGPLTKAIRDANKRVRENGKRS